MIIFSATHVYNQRLFKSKFRIRIPLFLRIMSVVIGHNSYFIKRPSVTSVMGLSIQNCVAVINMFAYGIGANTTEESRRLSKSTAIEDLKRIVQ